MKGLLKGFTVLAICGAVTFGLGFGNAEASTLSDIFNKARIHREADRMEHKPQPPQRHPGEPRYHPGEPRNHPGEPRRPAVSPTRYGENSRQRQEPPRERRQPPRPNDNKRPMPRGII